MAWIVLIEMIHEVKVHNMHLKEGKREVRESETRNEKEALRKREVRSFVRSFLRRYTRSVCT